MTAWMSMALPLRMAPMSWAPVMVPVAVIFWAKRLSVSIRPPLILVTPFSSSTVSAPSCATSAERLRSLPPSTPSLRTPAAPFSPCPSAVTWVVTPPS